MCRLLIKMKEKSCLILTFELNPSLRFWHCDDSTRYTCRLACICEKSTGKMDQLLINEIVTSLLQAYFPPKRGGGGEGAESSSAPPGSVSCQKVGVTRSGLKKKRVAGHTQTRQPRWSKVDIALS